MQAQQEQQRRLSECLAELQGALGVVEQVGVGGLVGGWAMAVSITQSKTFQPNLTRVQRNATQTLRQYTEGGAGPQGITPHEKFAATKLAYYGLCRLNGLLGQAALSKEALLPLEGPLVQVGGWVRCVKGRWEGRIDRSDG